MTVALSDTLLLASMLRPLPDFSDALATAAATRAFYTERKPLSATINTLANALYQAGRLLLCTPSVQGDTWPCKSRHLLLLCKARASYIFAHGVSVRSTPSASPCPPPSTSWPSRSTRQGCLCCACHQNPCMALQHGGIWCPARQQPAHMVVPAQL